MSFMLLKVFFTFNNPRRFRRGEEHHAGQGEKESDGYLRFSYATSMKNITGGMDRIEEFTKKMK